MLGNMLRASYNAVSNCVSNAVLSGVIHRAALLFQADTFSICGTWPIFNSFDQATEAESIIEGKSSK